SRQKTRHTGASKAYKLAHRRMLGTQLISAFLFYIALAICSITYPQYWPFLLGGYMIRLLLQLAVYYPIMRKLRVKGLIWVLPFLDIAYYTYICVNGFFALFKKNIRWK